MTVAAPARLAPAALSTDHLLDTPLPQLLAELDVDAYDSSIPDRSFFGAVGQRKNGQLFLALPAGRSAFERDTTARYLLAKAFKVALPDLPAPFETTHL